ncbi:methyl-accepting chemotaxis protein [candidate division FCPU426 bacterium]|nr:methyl-accepting chemotaxis protein [candidate division FCPU426 bacterium]
MQYFFKQYALKVVFTLLAALGVTLYLLRLGQPETDNLQFLYLSLFTIAPAMLIMDYWVIYRLFLPVLDWLRLSQERETKGAKETLLAANRVLVFPYQLAFYFLIVFMLLAAVVFLLLLFLNVFSSEYSFYICLAVILAVSVCMPIVLHFSKIILDPIRRQLVWCLTQQDFESVAFSFGIRPKLLLISLSLAVFCVVFGSLLTFEPAQRAMRKQAVSHLEYTLQLANRFLTAQAGDASTAELTRFLDGFRPGPSSYLFLMSKSNPVMINNHSGYSYSELKEKETHNLDLLNDIIVVARENLHAGYILGGVYHRKDFTAAGGRLQGGLVLLVVIALCIASVLSIFYSQEIVSALRRFMQSVAALRSGDLTVRVQFLSEDETGEMGRFLEQMRQSLYNVNVKIKNASSVVLLTAQKLFEHIDSVSSSSHAINRNTNQLEDTMNQQFERVEYVAEVMNQLQDSYTQVAQRAELTAHTSKQASITAVQGSHEIQDIVNQMEEIRSVVHASRLSVEQLTQKSGEIRETIGLISQISRSTNTLALNAAIEAARSGEAGRGFSVVAEEVRKLAESSASAAQVIADKVNEIIIVAQRVYNSMVKGEEEVESGREMVIQTNNSFRQIVQSFQDAHKQANAIAQETVAQSKKTKEITTAVKETAEVSEVTAASTREVKEGTGQQTKSIEEMAGQVRRMNALAEELQQLVNRYKLIKNI